MAGLRQAAGLPGTNCHPDVCFHNECVVRIYVLQEADPEGFCEPDFHIGLTLLNRK